MRRILGFLAQCIRFLFFIQIAILLVIPFVLILLDDDDPNKTDQPTAQDYF